MIAQILLISYSSYGPNPIYALLGIPLFILAIVLIVRNNKKRKSSKQLEESYKEKDILGLEKQSATDFSTYQPIYKVINWRAAFLILLVIIGLFLIFNDRPTYKKKKYNTYYCFDCYEIWGAEPTISAADD